MKRAAALYDIHSNFPALRAVLEDVRKAEIDLILIGGDMFPGPMPFETIQCLQNLDTPVHFIRGNGDREVLSLLKSIQVTPTLPKQAQIDLRWVAEQLPHSLERFIARWPEAFRVPVEGLGEVLFCHATPFSDVEIFTRLTPEDRLAPLFQGVQVPIVVCGHTHMQFERQVGDTRVVNAGSVGMPFGKPGADWLLLGPGIEFRHTSYNLAQAAQLVRNTKYPQAEGFAANNILNPPSEEQMLQLLNPSKQQ